MSLLTQRVEVGDTDTCPRGQGVSHCQPGLAMFGV